MGYTVAFGIIWAIYKLMPVRSLLQKIGLPATFGRGTKEIAPPVLCDAARFPYGPFSFNIQLTSGLRFRIFASTDLVHWAPICDGVANAEVVEYVDSEASKFSYRFYRSVVEQVSSRNVVGYASVSLPPGFSPLANPFNSSSTVSQLFKGWPDGTTLTKFDASSHSLVENSLAHGKWTNPAERLLPGEGAIFFNPTNDYKSYSFVGEVAQGTLMIPVPSGFTMRSSLVPKPGDLRENLSFPISDGDVIHIFDRDRQKYVLHPFENGKWSAEPAVLSVGESFWVAKTTPGNWTQSLVIADL